MLQVLTTFGIDWRLLLINAVNFGLLLLALWYFLYTPILNMLEQRRQKVARGVEDARAAAREREEIEASRGDMLASAGKEADEIVVAARAAGTKKERELLLRAEASAAAVLREAQAQAHEEKARAIAESKQEVAKLIVLGMEKLTQ
jgi:F-type H+-transporting ATPase subunit b